MTAILLHFAHYISDMFILQSPDSAITHKHKMMMFIEVFQPSSENLGQECHRMLWATNTEQLSSHGALRQSSLGQLYLAGLILSFNNSLLGALHRPGLSNGIVLLKFWHKW